MDDTGWPAYDGDRQRHFAMPLGGIGTGTVALAGNGALRQWQLHNTGNHVGQVPDSFFAIRVSQGEPVFDAVRLLQAPPVADGPSTPLITDDVVPASERRLHSLVPSARAVRVQAAYPMTRVSYDTDLPVAVELEAFNPLVPADPDRSSLPVACFTFTVRNDSPVAASGWLGGSLQNSVGWDGVTPVDGVACPLYGGNTNRVRRIGDWTAVVLENATLPADHRGAGQLVLATDAESNDPYPQWSAPEQFVSFLASHSCLPGPWAPERAAGPSAAGTTWNAGLASRFSAGPGESARIRFLVAWHFPNRYVDFGQFGPRRDYGHSRFWLGNAYTVASPDAVAVAEQVTSSYDSLREATLDWVDALGASSLPGETAYRMASLVADVRSTTVFRTADGTVLGFEGVSGASTAMWGGQHGGSCPLNCTHVWNYEQTMSRLFPALERDMRDTEFDVMQAPEGYIPHRVHAPLYTKQFWGVWIGGPDEPALDGMLGTVLKTYREVRQGAGLDWLARRWPSIERLVDHIRTKWDPDGTGVLRGIQPSTHDIDLRGVNSFMGSYWLAALRAADELASLLDATTDLGKLFERCSAAYDELLFTGEYYRQVLEPGEPTEYQWGDGCLTDQLVGQWWAHQLGLGHLLPAEHVRTALRAVVRHNLRHGFDGFEHDQRVFADGDDTGLLMCSWPHGGRPEVPTRYCDEVWTGSEYQLAAHCIYEGLYDEGMAVLQGLWDRYDGSRRNPFNPIECGDHYIRNAAGWSVLEALAGFSYDAVTSTLSLAPVAAARSKTGWRVPFVAGTGWGAAARSGDTFTLSCLGGRLALSRAVVDGSEVALHGLAAGETVDVPLTA